MGDNPHPTGSDASVTEAMVTAALRATGLGVWSKDVAIRMRAALTAALSLPTPKGKHIEDVYPDEAVAWIPSDQLVRLHSGGSHQTMSAPVFSQDVATAGPCEPLYAAVQLLSAKQQGIAEERERCAKIAEADAAASKSNWENARGSEKAYHLWAEQAATGIASAIRGAS